jgi:hypothetical protein
MGQLALSYPPGGADPVDRFSGLLALAQHPLTGVIYGMRKTSDAFSRELVTINPNTGETKLVGTIGMHVTSFAFVPAPALRIDSITRSGNNMIITWSGGTPRYQLQSRSSLTSGSWTDVGTSTTALTATVPMSGPQMFYRVVGQ